MRGIENVQVRRDDMIANGIVLNAKSSGAELDVLRHMNITPRVGRKIGHEIFLEMNPPRRDVRQGVVRIDERLIANPRRREGEGNDIV